MADDERPMTSSDRPDPTELVFVPEDVLEAMDYAGVTLVDEARLAALENLAEAARRRRQTSIEATQAIMDNRAGLIDVHAYNEAMAASTLAEAALDAALAALEDTP